MSSSTNKVQYKSKNVKYLGHIFSNEGIRIDPDRVKAIMAIKSPNNVAKLQSILSIVNFLRNFISNLSTKIVAFRKLLKKNVEFQWLPIREKYLNDIKQQVKNAPVLANFDRDKDITIQAGASQYGLGCCLLQNNKPIYYASRSLTDSQKNLAQIKKELLSIVFATQKFHYYIYGKEINIITDHKPLVNLMNKKIAEIPSSRLQRMGIKLLKYQIKISYTSGKLMHIANLLSRSFLEEINEDDTWLTEVVHSIETGLSISSDKKEEFKKAINEDPVLDKLKYYHLNDWPKLKKDVEDPVQFYFNLQDQITV